MFYVSETHYKRQIEEVNSQGSTLKQSSELKNKMIPQQIMENDSDLFERDPACQVDLYEEEKERQSMLLTIDQAE